MGAQQVSPGGFPRVTLTSACIAPAPFSAHEINPTSVFHSEGLKRGPRATGRSLCKHFLGPSPEPGLCSAGP